MLVWLYDNYQLLCRHLPVTDGGAIYNLLILFLANICLQDICLQDICHQDICLQVNICHCDIIFRPTYTCHKCKLTAATSGHLPVKILLSRHLSQMESNCSPSPPGHIQDKSASLSFVIMTFACLTDARQSFVCQKN